MPSVAQAGASNTFGLRPSLDSWTLTRDFLVIGEGVVSLSAARWALELGLDVLIIDSVEQHAGACEQLRFTDATMNLIQGGFAVIEFDDNPSDHVASGFDGTADSHIVSTLDAGTEHYDEETIASIIRAGVTTAKWLIGLDATSDPASDNPAVHSHTKEDGHHARRIIHAGGDATGAGIERALEASVTGVRVLQDATTHQPIVGKDGRMLGALVADPRNGGAIRTGTALPATGGVRHIYRATTAPLGTRSEAIGMTSDAGTGIRDMEFIQFHPTVFYDEYSTSDDTG